MPAVLTRIVAHSILAALCAIGGLALAQSPRVQPAQPSAVPRFARARARAAERPAHVPAGRPHRRRRQRRGDHGQRLRSRVAISEMQLRRQKIQPPPRRRAGTPGARTHDRRPRPAAARPRDGRARRRRHGERGHRTHRRIQRTVRAGASPAHRGGRAVVHQFRDDIRQDIILSRLREREVDNRILISDRTRQLRCGTGRRLRRRAGSEPCPDPAAGAGERGLGAHRRDPQRAETCSANCGRRRLRPPRGQLLQCGEALQGGELGWRSTTACQPLRRRDPEREDRETTGILRSPNGFHISRSSVAAAQSTPSWLPARCSRRTRGTSSCASATDAGTRCHPPAPGIQGTHRSRPGRVRHAGAAALPRSTGSRGGDLGWLYPGDTVPEFEKAMDGLKLNEISAPVRSPFGWHLIQVLERRTEQGSGDRARMQARLGAARPQGDEATRSGCGSCATRRMSSCDSTSAADFVNRAAR